MIWLLFLKYSNLKLLKNMKAFTFCFYSYYILYFEFVNSVICKKLHFLFSDRDRYQLGSLSHYINSKAVGYHDLPDCPEVAPDPSVRNVETQVPWQEFNFVKKKKANVKKKSFYSETESSSAEGGMSFHKFTLFYLFSDHIPLVF